MQTHIQSILSFTIAGWERRKKSEKEREGERNKCASQVPFERTLQ